MAPWKVGKRTKQEKFSLPLSFKEGEMGTNMTNRISWEEYQRIKDIKKLDLELCDFCCRLNILNLGWKPFGKYYCYEHEKEHVLCRELCLKVGLNILDCELRRKRIKKAEIPIKPNRAYDLCACYLCGKELAGASKKGVIKNRNNPGFWGISSVYKILCLKCVGRKYWKRMVSWQRKKYREYIRRKYV